MEVFAMGKSLSKCLLLVISLFIFNNVSAQWVKTSLYVPSTVGILQIYSNNEIIFATPASHDIRSLYRSIDGGATWTKADKGIDLQEFGYDLGSGVFVTQVISNGINNHFYCIASGEVYLSTNTGSDWTKIFDKQSTESIRVDSSGYLVVCGNYGVFKTIDEGKSWIDLKFGVDLFRKYVRSIEIDAHNNIYALSGTAILYRYDSITNTWAETTPLPSGNGTLMFKVNSLGNIFLLDTKYNLYSSLDGGNSWQNVITNSPVSSYAGGFLLVDKKDNIITLTNSGIILSFDSGKTWKTIYSDSFGSMFSTDDNRIYVVKYTGSSESIILSTDYGNTWNPFHFICAKVTAVCVENNKIFAGTQRGLFITTDKGDTWTQTTKKGNTWTSPFNNTIFSIAGNTNNMMVACDGTASFFSSDDGLTWKEYNKDGDSRLVTILSDNTLIDCGSSYSYSKDYGSTWKKMNGMNGTIIKFAKSTNGYVYSLNYDDGGCRSGMPCGSEWIIYRSTDNGLNWLKVFSKYNHPYISIPPPEILSSLGCSSDGAIFVSSHLGLYRSNDNGDNWTKIDSLAEHANLTNFAFNSLGHIYANKGNAIFKSMDNGNNWTFIDSTLWIETIPISKLYQVLTLAIDDDDYLYVGTTYQGLLKSTFPTTSVDNVNTELPKQFLLAQNYPNPFNPSTTIIYSIPASLNPSEGGTLVSLKIFDLLGREVATLVNEQKSPGNYEVKFDGSELPSGVYFYKLAAGDFMETKKMLLLK
jgi:photosystem II stability/assembly factor-like uncharacterized protein